VTSPLWCPQCGRDLELDCDCDDVDRTEPVKAALEAAREALSRAGAKRKPR
jgi:hypothetical protein